MQEPISECLVCRIFRSRWLKAGFRNGGGKESCA